MKIKFRKRHFLLLEVIIAFILIVMCIIPLISPHTFILIEQKKFIHKIEADHLVNLTYADIVERLYLNEIPWNRVVSGDGFEIDDSLLERIKYEKMFPYKGTYRFGEIKHKPKDESLRKLYLLKLEMKFVPADKSKKDYEEEVPGTLNYYYELFVVRDLGEGELSAFGEEQSSEGDEIEKKEEGESVAP